MNYLNRFLLIGISILVPHLLCAAEVQEVKSAKGITAWLVEDHTMPVVSMSFAWRGGIEHDPDGKEGLSYLAADMMNEGAGAYDANAFRKLMQENAISLGFQAQRDSITGELRSLKETLPTALALLHDSLTAPRFEEQDLQNKKSEILSAIKRYESEPDWLLSRMMMKEIFAGHPYSKRTLGSETSVKTISRADLKEWHRHLGREGLLVSVTGDMSKDELVNFLDKTFGDLPEKTGERDAPEAQLRGGKESFLFKFKTPQTGLLLVWPGITRKDKDWYALEVMNYILGGGSFSSRLMDEIREKRGLTYGINSGMSNFDHAETFTIQASCRNEKAGEVIALVKNEIARIRDAKVSADEINGAKDFLIGAYALGLTSTSHVADHYLQLQRYGLGRDYQTVHEKGVRAVTAEDVQAVAKRVLKDDAIVSFFVGAPEGVTPTRTLESLE